jgi:hypothetical protein
MPNVFADTHDPPPPAPRTRPAPRIDRHTPNLSSLLFRCSTERLDDAVANFGIVRYLGEPDDDLRARAIALYAADLETRLDASRALVARVRAAIGARPSESTDAALSRLRTTSALASRDNIRLSGIVRGVRAALGAAEGADLVFAAADLRETVNRFRDAAVTLEKA